MGQAFRNNRELQQFVLTDVTPTGRILGTGSFGSVEEVRNFKLNPKHKPVKFIIWYIGDVQTSGLCWQEDA